MTLEDFYKELSYLNTAREHRMKYAKMVLDDLSLLPKLLDILFMVDDKVSSRAAWVLEFVCAEYIYAIVPYLEIFTKNLNTIHLDSSVRPVSKICEFITREYYSKHPNTIKKTLHPQYQKRIIEACFDWMISDQKVAPKVYAMESLFLYGLDYNWIHPELTQILEQDFATQSAGFKARAKRTLQKMKKRKAS